MSFLKTWSEPIPQGNRAVNLGDNDINDFKTAIRERLAVDHRFYETEAGKTNIGAHDKASFINQSANPAALANALILFSKDVTAKSELHSRHEDAGITQLTRNGKLWVSALGIASEHVGDILYHNGTIMTRLGGNVSTTRKFLRQTGDGGSDPSAPAWDTLVSGDLPSGVLLQSAVYDSGFFAVANATAYTKTHNLGTTKALFIVYWASTSGGADMSNVAPLAPPYGSDHRGYQIVEITTTTIKIQTGGTHTQSLVNAGGSTYSIKTGGFYRVIGIPLA